MRCMLYRLDMGDEFVNNDYESLLKQIMAFSVLKNSVLRCAVYKYGEKIIDLRILIELINNILTLKRIHELDPASATITHTSDIHYVYKSNSEFTSGQLSLQSTLP